MIDLEKRRRVMQRSIKLGHCICNPKQSCPCSVFKEKDICPCAGERIEQAVQEVKLTQFVEKTVCASKINQNDLKKVLAELPLTSDPRILVGTNTCDDAGVYQLDKETTLVQTVDVFSPSVDDPYTFGQIAAANSLSDVYAMGGKPLTALSIIGFPIETLSHRAMTQMLRGGMDKMMEAGVVIIGGHSINDPNPKFGYAVTGVINASNMVTNDKAKPGDVLVLTKPLGVGIISFAGQIGRASETALAAASRSMATLNKTAAEIMIEIGVSAATDVTGFGLFGHLGEMASQSGVTAEIYVDKIPVFDEVLDYVAQGIIPGGIERNSEHASERVSVADDVNEDLLQICYDPQTSGGLLIAIDEEKVDMLIAQLKDCGVDCATIIGRITSKSDGYIMLKNNADYYTFTPKKEATDMVLEDCCGGNGDSSCCSGEAAVTESTPSAAKERFSAFMKEINSGGAIPLRTKELMAIALSLVSKCEPCVKIHLDKARSMGITEDEINEATWMAIAFGGAPIMMFYETIKEEV
jgi:selenide,water dikinase